MKTSVENALFGCWFDVGGINVSDFSKQMQMVLYHSDDGDVSVNVYMKDEEFWITPKAMAELLVLINLESAGI